MTERYGPCLKCGERMEIGLTVEHTEGGNLVSSWVEGLAEKGPLGGLKIKGKTAFQIVTYRCTSCGYLESYAGP